MKTKIQYTSNTPADVTNDLTDTSNEEESDTDLKEPRGRPKSGRFWKTVKSRTRSIVKTPGLKMSLEEKMKLKRDLAYSKSLSREVVEKKKKEREERKLRRINNLKKKEENERKSEIVQVIKNPDKIKKMRKKNLRSIEKRDTLVMK